MYKERNHATEKKQKFSGGATASVLPERFDLIPFAGVEGAARRFALGAVKHGDNNWKKGGKEFALARLNHLMRHASLFAQFRRREDLDAIVCNAMMLEDFAERGIL